MGFPTRVHDPGWLRGRPGRKVLDRLAPTAVAIAYWLAVGLPVVYLALLASGIESRSGLGLFLGLLVAHLMALVGGRNHEP